MMPWRFSDTEADGLGRNGASDIFTKVRKQTLRQLLTISLLLLCASTAFAEKYTVKRVETIKASVETVEARIKVQLKDSDLVKEYAKQVKFQRNKEGHLLVGVKLKLFDGLQVTRITPDGDDVKVEVWITVDIPPVLKSVSKKKMNSMIDEQLLLIGWEKP